MAIPHILTTNIHHKQQQHNTTTQQHNTTTQQHTQTFSLASFHHEGPIFLSSSKDHSLVHYEHNTAQRLHLAGSRGG
jgi:hypothetical protein